jgi:hypothetical protein
MDYFGPLLVTVGRRHEKRWGVIFTCLTTRGVYLELASSLDTDACIMAVRNFSNRWGSPKEIWSDNGTNMRGAEAELGRSLVDLDKKRLNECTQSYLPGNIRTKWHFITPKAPHMGGAWERLIRIAKCVIYSCLKDKAPKDDVLRSFLVEAEGILNSRPLTYMPFDNESQEAITPNHILKAGRITVTPGVFENKFYQKRWKISQQLADEFWHRFVLEYLPDLTKRAKWCQDGKEVCLGDVVIIIDETAPRNTWEKGIIHQLHPSADGKVRSASVRTASTIRKRPVSKLAILVPAKSNNFS